MLANQLAVKYAQAIFELARDKKALTEVEQQLVWVNAAISENNDLATLLYHPRVPAAAKKDTIIKVFGQDLADYVRNFLLLLVDKRRETAFPAIVREYRRLVNEANNIIEADVTTAMPLSDAEHQALAARLAKVTGKNVVLKLSTNENIIGGVIVKIGDKLIDGSVARQLQALKAALLKTEVTKIGVTS